MADKSIRRLAITSCWILGGLFFGCLIFTQNWASSQIVGVQASFVLVHQIAGAVISAIGIALFLVHYSGKLPSVSLGRSLLMLMIGLAVFSMSPLFGIAAVAVYIFDKLKPSLKLENDDPD